MKISFATAKSQDSVFKNCPHISSLKLKLHEAVRDWEKCAIQGHCTLTILFIFDDEEPALCFRKLFSSSGFPSFGFKIIRLLPAVPSEEDLRRFSMNLHSRWGLKLLARFTGEKTRNTHQKPMLQKLFNRIDINIFNSQCKCIWGEALWQGCPNSFLSETRLSHWGSFVRMLPLGPIFLKWG